jgi:hypothetical protein
MTIDTDTFIALAFLFGSLIMLLSCCMLFSKITPGIFRKNRISNISQEEENNV